MVLGCGFFLLLFCTTIMSKFVTSFVATTAQHVIDLTGKATQLSPGFTVRRILPSAKKRTVGSFCFVDHFGPTTRAMMDVGPHPHIGLSTLTYLYQGAILHSDSTGAQQVIVPGGVNYMVAGKGVVHSERGKPESLAAFGIDPPTNSHGMQLWLALPRDSEDVDASFHAGRAVLLQDEPNIQVHLVVGSFGGQTVPDIPMDPAMGHVMFVDVWLGEKGGSFDLNSAFVAPSSTPGEDLIEMGIYVVSGAIEIAMNDGSTGEKTSSITAAVAEGTMSIWNIPTSARWQGGTITATSPDTRIAILGGTALPEPRYMMWNFVSHSRDKLDRAAAAWRALDRIVFPPVVGEDNLDSIPLPEKGYKKK